MQVLSSKFTFFYKYILVLIWIVGFGLGTREVLFLSQQFDAKWLQYFGCWVGISLCIYFATGSIKQVHFDQKNNTLKVSNFLKTSSINCSDIVDIDGSSLLSPKLVWFVLRNSSPFGKKINFMPATRPTRGIGKHPMVMELRKEFNLDR